MNDHFRYLQDYFHGSLCAWLVRSHKSICSHERTALLACTEGVGLIQLSFDKGALTKLAFSPFVLRFSTEAPRLYSGCGK